MKKFYVICIAGLMILAAGCSPSATLTPTAPPTVAPSTAPASTGAVSTATPPAEATETPAGETTEPSATPGELEPLGLQDLTVVVEGEYYDLQSDVGAMLETLGEEFEVNDVKGRYTDDTEKQYVYADITITAYPSDDAEVMYCVEFTSDAFDTARAIHPGSTVDEIKAAYGDGYYEDNGAMIYTFDGEKADDQKSSLTFKLKDGAVTSVVIYNANDIQ
jgi:hypothetical protein